MERELGRERFTECLVCMHALTMWVQALVDTALPIVLVARRSDPPS